MRDSNGNILSCSAAIKESQYLKDGGKFHSKQIVRERLWKVVWLASDGKSGIFLSPSRGLVSYDSVSDSFDEVGRDDGRLSGGSVDVFPDKIERERVLCHILHSILRDGSRISYLSAGCQQGVSRAVAAGQVVRRHRSGKDTQ